MVCLGNICRSPLAEGILRDKAEKEGLDISVDSAGTAAYHVGNLPDERSIREALLHDINLNKQTARQFSIDDFDAFDFIFAMDLQNKEDILSLARSKEDRNKVHLLLEEAPELKLSEVPDPYYGGPEGFSYIYKILDQAITSFLKTQ